MSIKILFVPHPGGGPSHLIPLVALFKMLEAGEDIQASFFLSKELKVYSDILESNRVEYLDIHNARTISSELSAYSKYEPDIVIDDTSFSTGYAVQMHPVSRITIRRTGLFPGVPPRNKNHVHSIGSLEDLPDVRMFGLQKYDDLTQYFKADAGIVPGIPAIEQVGDELKNDTSCFFSGPLIMDDLPHTITPGLERFFQQVSRKKKVFLTYGAIAVPPHEIFQCLRFLLQNDVAVVTNARLEKTRIRELEEKYPGIFYYTSYLPMHYVSANTDLIIHQCGSAAYHYPILNGKPSITLGTRAFDREDVALRLEELGVNEHIDAPQDTKDFFSQFKEKVHKYLSSDTQWLAEKLRKQRELKNQILQASGSFDIWEVLETAINNHFKN